MGPQVAAVAAGSRPTAGAAATVLRAGGNAVDAAVAAGFTAAVAEPGLSSLGGGGFALLRHPDGAHELLDFFVDAPGRGLSAPNRTPHFTPVVVQFAGAEQVFHAGWGSVAVPGCLAGYLRLHRDHGRLPLGAITAPAAAAARDGVAAEPAQVDVLRLLTGIVELTPQGRRLLGPAATAEPGAEVVLRNDEYATFLDAVAAGLVDGFGSQPYADALAATMADHHGLVTLADLVAYEPSRREPLVTEYLTARVATNAPPSFGGAILVDALESLARSRDAASPGAQSNGTAARDLVAALADATQRRKQDAGAAPQSTRGTTHISVVDGDGLMVSMTTSNGSCSGVFVPGTGVQLNNVLGERDLHPAGFHAVAPGTRIGSMMAPSVVELPDGSVVALGSGGSERIRSALLQTVVRLVDGADLGVAVGTPRLHWDGVQVQAEPGLPASVLAAVGELGPVNEWPAPDLYFGGVQAVRRHPDGSVEAVGDPRRGGVGLVVEV